MAKELACSACHTVIKKPKKHTKGSFLIEVILWISFIIPGLIYTIWRVSSRSNVCPECGSQNLIPSSSPAAQKFLNIENAA